MTLGDVSATFAPLAEAKALKQEQHRDGEAVVELHRVDVVGRHASLGHGRRATGGCRGGGEIGHLADVPMGLPTGGAQNVDGRLTEVSCPLGRSHDQGAPSIGDHATIQLV